MFVNNAVLYVLISFIIPNVYYMKFA